MAYNARHLTTRGFALFILIFYILSNISSHVRTIAAYERVRSDCSHYMRRNVENRTPSRTSIDHRCTSALSKSLPWPIVNKMKITCLQWQKWVVLWFVNFADRICSNISIIVFSCIYETMPVNKHVIACVNRWYFLQLQHYTMTGGGLDFVSCPQN